MIKFNQVEYDVANLLSKNCHEIIVFSPSCGHVFKFDSDDWAFKGMTGFTKDSVLKEIGIGGMNKKYIFLFVHAVAID